jgi:hypothetical protein
METREEAFPGYVVSSNKTGPAFYIFVLAYTAFAFFLIAPLVKWSRSYEKKRLLEDAEQMDPENPAVADDKESQNDGNAAPTTQQGAARTSPSTNRNITASTSESQAPTNNTNDRSKSEKSGSVSGGRGRLGLLLRELDKVAAAEYPDCNPDFKSRISGSVQPRQTVRSKAPTENSSGLPSAATTSRLHLAPSSRRLPALVLDVGGRRWKHRRPLGRVDVIQNAIKNATGSMIMKGPVVASGKKRSRKGMSDLASSTLEDQKQDMNPAFFNQSVAFHRQRFYSGAGSYSGASGKSILSSIVDDISPNDAADANDPGKGNIFIHPDSRTMQQKQGFAGLKLGCLSPIVEGLLELAAPDEETIRVIRTSFPLSIGATSEALFRLITASFISQYLGSESMVAYLLVGLFVRLTSEELSGAIIDALSSFVQASLFSGEGDVAYLAGQYVQLAVVLQLLLGIPLLLVWALTMESVVFWFVQSRSIALIAEDYAKVVVFNYLIQAISRTCTVVFHICGHEHFESVIDFSASTLQVILIACIVALFDDATLTTVGSIQVLIGVAASVAKVMFPFMRGWMQPFRKGMFQNVALVQVRSPVGLALFLKITTLTIILARRIELPFGISRGQLCLY